MSLNNFIPQLWADTLLAALRKQLVFGALFNTDYEGELQSYGDTVRINAIGDITISAYTKDTDLNSPQSLTDAQTMLTISQASYYNFIIDDVDQAQAHPEVMTEAMRWAAYKLALTMDLYYAGFYTDAISANTLSSSGSPTVIDAGTSANIADGKTAYDVMTILGQYLTQQAVPKQGRWAVVPPWIKTYLIQDIRFTGFNTDAGRMSIMSGKLDASAGNATDAYLGQIDGMDVYESLNAPHVSGTVGAANSIDVITCGHRMAVTKAEGLNKTEAYRPPLRFGDAVKGLALYGAKTVRPYALAAAYVQHP